VKFLVDAQLPRRIARLLESLGHDALHTLDLPTKNQTPDETLRQLAGSERRVLVTKDADFVDSFLLRGLPQRLLFVTTGNIPNDDLLALFRTNLPAITDALSSHSFVEIDRSGLTVHS
jgi:predicted nuclease of predicted toxin-antitoxin system